MSELLEKAKAEIARSKENDFFFLFAGEWLVELIAEIESAEYRHELEIRNLEINLEQKDKLAKNLLGIIKSSQDKLRQLRALNSNHYMNKDEFA